MSASTIVPGRGASDGHGTVAATSSGPAVVEIVPRATIVSTAKASPIEVTAAATPLGFGGVERGGLAGVDQAEPGTPQKMQRSPQSMNVAVPSAQHSERFGHPASSHTVTGRMLTHGLLESEHLGAETQRRPHPRRLGLGDGVPFVNPGLRGTAEQAETRAVALLPLSGVQRTAAPAPHHG